DTPYQPEVSPGTLQTIYEYQSLLAELTGLDVVSASHYDGAAATAEAALMTVRATRRQRVLVSRAVHRHYVETTQTYFRGAELSLEELPSAADGTTDLAALERALGDAARPVAGVILGQPNAFGLLEPMAEAARLAHAAGALFVAVVEPVSLALLAPPGAYGADIAAGEGQPLGIAPQYGGPYLGVLACSEALVRQIPGRLVGRTTDLQGRRAFVMTLRAREQDIRRERAASNICTNQALCALAATVYVACLGPHGLRDVAALGAARGRELERALARIGASRVHRAPYLNEFAVRVPDAPAVHERLLARGVLAGLPLARWYPDDGELRDALLVCATEVTTARDIDRFAEALASELGTTGLLRDAAGTAGAAR
ncbi:MAG: aminomethyl-transferring glycine dehydrogenase subunit GcvPA, partial [Candidatus Limnocylindrales bacterium]